MCVLAPPPQVSFMDVARLAELTGYRRPRVAFG
jgi:hypothetical protein